MPRKKKEEVVVEKKKTSKELADIITNTDAYKKMREENAKKESELFKRRLSANTVEVICDSRTWWNQPMKKGDFKIMELEGKFYAQHIAWKKHIWIGAYNSQKEVEDVIKSYVKESSKENINRNINNIHSIILENI